ncbi:MAG TPA: hypothetical protein VGN72_14535 [Tepidisphaeraceae bacterium]|jgi:DNA-binding NarL/FixJ family response regulator|nr:hypothetical protein [Tepidisphaeraceae bacterium]
MFSSPDAPRRPTVRQADVLALFDAGWSRRELARQLKLSPGAARSRAKRARQRAKFGVSRDALRKREKNTRPAMRAA